MASLPASPIPVCAQVTNLLRGPCLADMPHCIVRSKFSHLSKWRVYAHGWDRSLLTGPSHVGIPN